MFVDDNISNYIKVFAAFEDGGAFIKYAAIVFICVGCFVLLVGFLGCCGAIKESRCMLGMVGATHIKNGIFKKLVYFIERTY